MHSGVPYKTEHKGQIARRHRATFAIAINQIPQFGHQPKVHDAAQCQNRADRLGVQAIVLHQDQCAKSVKDLHARAFEKDQNIIQPVAFFHQQAGFFLAGVADVAGQSGHEHPR